MSSYTPENKRLTVVLREPQFEAAKARVEPGLKRDMANTVRMKSGEIRKHVYCTITKEQDRALREIVRREGYPSLSEYLRALVRDDLLCESARTYATMGDYLVSLLIADLARRVEG